MSKNETVVINGVEYEPKVKMENQDGLNYVCVRTYSAGVHTGYLQRHEGKEVTLVNARRIWKWSGAFTLSELATKGVEKPEECKFSCVVPKIILTEAIEIIPMTEKATTSIKEVQDYDYS